MLGMKTSLVVLCVVALIAITVSMAGADILVSASSANYSRLLAMDMSDPTATGWSVLDYGPGTYWCGPLGTYGNKLFVCHEGGNDYNVTLGTSSSIWSYTFNSSGVDVSSGTLFATLPGDGAYGMDVDAYGNLYVIGSPNQSTTAYMGWIAKVDQQGHVTPIHAGGSTYGNYGVVRGHDGYTYFVGSTQYIFRQDENNGASPAFKGSANSFGGISCGADGKIYACDGVDVYAFTPGTTDGTIFSSNTTGVFASLVSCNWCSDGYLYVTPNAGSPIVKLDTNGNATQVMANCLYHLDNVTVLPTNLPPMATVNVTLAGYSSDLIEAPVNVDLINSSGTVLATQTLNLPGNTVSSAVFAASGAPGLQSGGLPQGAYTVRARAAGFLSDTASVNLTSAGGSSTITITLRNGDVNGDNTVEDSDYAIMSGTWYQHGN